MSLLKKQAYWAVGQCGEQGQTMCLPDGLLSQLSHTHAAGVQMVVDLAGLHLVTDARSLLFKTALVFGII